MLDTLSNVPLELLRTELYRRQEDGSAKPECGSAKKGGYNTGVHVFALFLILILSTLGKSLSVQPDNRSDIVQHAPSRL